MVIRFVLQFPEDFLCQSSSPRISLLLVYYAAFLAYRRERLSYRWTSRCWSCRRVPRWLIHTLVLAESLTWLTWACSWCSTGFIFWWVLLELLLIFLCKLHLSAESLSSFIGETEVFNLLCPSYFSAADLYVGCRLESQFSCRWLEGTLRIHISQNRFYTNSLFFRIIHVYNLTFIFIFIFTSEQSWYASEHFWYISSTQVLSQY